jgi:hypothetical protein
MLIAIETGQGPRLENVDDFKGFSIRASCAPEDRAKVAAALADARAGAMADLDHAFILPAEKATRRGGVTSTKC